MSNRFLAVLIALSSFADAQLPAVALPMPAIIHGLQSTDISDALILVRKGKGHGDGEERFERHHRHEFRGVSRHHGYSHRMRGFNGNQGFGGGNQNQPNGQN